MILPMRLHPPLVSATLPLTSYIKMVEVWLIFNLFIPFLEVLLHTYMDHLRCQYKYGVALHSCNLPSANPTILDNFWTNIVSVLPS